MKNNDKKVLTSNTFLNIFPIVGFVACLILAIVGFVTSNMNFIKTGCIFGALNLFFMINRARSESNNH